MHGHVPAPPPRPVPRTGVVVLRIVFVSLCVLSLGMLAWGTMMRVAIVSRRALDWLLFALSLVVVIVTIAVIGSLPEEDDRTDVALAVLLAQAVAVIAYYLATDIRHHRTPYPAAVPPAGPYAPYLPPQPYGYGPRPQQPPAPGPHPPQHQRIDRVRAELDELSDYLRKEQER